MSDFLKRLKSSIENGEKDEELNDYLENIEKKSYDIDDPEKAIEKRLDKSGRKEEETTMSKEDVKKHNAKVEKEMKGDDEKWSELALINNIRKELDTLEKDYEDLMSKYEKSIKNLTEKLEGLEEIFIDNHGKDDLNMKIE